MSNKTPKDSSEKTASGPNLGRFVRKYFFGLLLAAVLLIAASIYFIPQSKYVCIEKKGWNSDYCQIWGEVVRTESSRAQGLSGRDSMVFDIGMLFIFEEKGRHCFWMKDMKFPIDIIWLDENKKIVTVAENVQPNSYPNSFCPDRDALYVVEINAGFAKSLEWSEGSVLTF